MGKFILKMCFVSALIALTIGCSEDEYFESDDFNNYLELSDYSDLSNLSVEDRAVLDEAEGRLKVHMKDGLYVIDYKSGYDVNISERLYDYITSNYNHFNSMVSKGKKFKRTKFGDPEPNDCAVLSISHYLDIPYQTVVDGLINRPNLTILKAVQTFKSSASQQSSIPLGEGSGILVVAGHVVNLYSVNTSYEPTINYLCYRVYYKDYQVDNNGGNGLYYNVTELDLPCTFEYDGSSNNIIYEYIK